jgi:hypothetical protein
MIDDPPTKAVPTTLQCRRHDTRKPGTAVPGVGGWRMEPVPKGRYTAASYPNASVASNAISDFRNIASNSLSYDRFR